MIFRVKIMDTNWLYSQTKLPLFRWILLMASFGHCPKVSSHLIRDSFYKTLGTNIIHIIHSRIPPPPFLVYCGLNWSFYHIFAETHKNNKFCSFFFFVLLNFYCPNSFTILVYIHNQTKQKSARETFLQGQLTL